MAQGHLTLWLDPPASPDVAGADRIEPGAPRALQLHLLDAAHREIDEPLTLVPPGPRPVEVPSGGRGFDWVEAPQPLSLPVDQLFADAAVARLSLDGATIAEIDLAEARRTAPGPPSLRRHINEGGAWKILLFSEFFTDPLRFFQAADDLFDFMTGMAPFDRPEIAREIHFEALFWPSPADGLFRTRVNGRLVHGDNALVERYRRASGARGDMMVVLVDSAVRGGAGGTRDIPAWVTITSSAFEHWEAVALHELGHSFGLADEYDNAQQPVPEPVPLERNVTASRNAASALWADLRTPGMGHDPTCNANGQPHVPAGTIGTFEGARYKRTGRFRAAADCLMRTTNQPFCPVCQREIVRVVTGG